MFTLEVGLGVETLAGDTVFVGELIRFKNLSRWRGGPIHPNEHKNAFNNKSLLVGCVDIENDNPSTIKLRCILIIIIFQHECETESWREGKDHNGFQQEM